MFPAQEGGILNFTVLLPEDKSRKIEAGQRMLFLVPRDEAALADRQATRG